MWFGTEIAAPWLLSRPLLPIIHAHASATEWCPAHASAVGRNGQFLVFVGTGGAGKSTAALACAAAGWRYAGDDFVLVNSVRRLVLPLFISGRLRFGDNENLAARLLQFRVAISKENDELRHEFRFANDIGIGRIAGGNVVRTFILRRRGEAPFSINRASSAQVFKSIISCTRLYAPGLAASLTKKLLGAAGMASSFFIDTGDDPLAIPCQLNAMLDKSRD